MLISIMLLDGVGITEFFFDWWSEIKGILTFYTYSPQQHQHVRCKSPDHDYYLVRGHPYYKNNSDGQAGI